MVSESRYQLQDLLRVMQRLRDPETGCPWDIEQDFKSIVPSTLEECYELAHAIEQEDFPHVAEELGDVLFQVIFYAQLGQEQQLFSFDDVVHTLVSKLLRRHPHVFAGGEIEGLVAGRTDIAAVKESWEAIKLQERQQKNQDGVLADVPVALPALPRAQKLQKRAASVGFDWPSSEGVMAKIHEELLELQVEIRAGNVPGQAEEAGDLLFTCVNLCRHLGLDAEKSLRGASSKFEQRFQSMEHLAGVDGTTLDQLDDSELDELWAKAKQQ
jgi:ATP diphosphatase